MLVSISNLKNALKKYQNAKKTKEKFSKIDSATSGISASFDSFYLVIAIIFFILEVILLFYAISIAINCSKGGSERIVNLVLASTFTFPYILLNILFNKCAKKTLQGKIT